MTELELFKYGFLLRCAEEGLTAEETASRIAQAREHIKTANPVVAGAAAAGAGAAGTKWLGSALSKGIRGGLGLAGLGLAGAAGVGAGAGWLGAKMTEPDADPAEAKTQELIETYRLFAEQAKRNAQRRRVYRPTISGPRLMR